MTIEATDTPITAAAVDALLSAIAAGRGGDVAGCFASDAILDATVPGWRFRTRGQAAIASQYAHWFDHSCSLEELERTATATGEAVVYLHTASREGVAQVAHHCHLFDIDAATGLITVDRMFCGGIWNAEDLAAMAEAQARRDAGAG